MKKYLYIEGLFPFMAAALAQADNAIFGKSNRFLAGIDIEKEYKLIGLKKCRYSAAKRRLIVRAYERIKNNNPCTEHHPG